MPRHRPRSGGRLRRHLRDSQAIIDTTTLNRSMVVIGKKNLKPGRSMTISPGKAEQRQRSDPGPCQAQQDQDGA